jgi:plasmid stabilization system protein ParE
LSAAKSGVFERPLPDVASLHPGYARYRVANDKPEIVRVLDGRQDIEERFAVREKE